MKQIKVYADFNGIFGDVLCLSHKEICQDKFGNEVFLREGMIVTAFDMDADEKGDHDDLIASGIVESSPDWLKCSGSKWILRIDENGVYHESDMQSKS